MIKDIDKAVPRKTTQENKPDHPITLNNQFSPQSALFIAKTIANASTELQQQKKQTV